MLKWLHNIEQNTDVSLPAAGGVIISDMDEGWWLLVSPLDEAPGRIFKASTKSAITWEEQDLNHMRPILVHL